MLKINGPTYYPETTKLLRQVHDFNHILLTTSLSFPEYQVYLKLPTSYRYLVLAGAIGTMTERCIVPLEILYDCFKHGFGMRMIADYVKNIRIFYGVEKQAHRTIMAKSFLELGGWLPTDKVTRIPGERPNRVTSLVTEDIFDSDATEFAFRRADNMVYVLDSYHTLTLPQVQTRLGFVVSHKAVNYVALQAMVYSASTVHPITASDVVNNVEPVLNKGKHKDWRLHSKFTSSFGGESQHSFHTILFERY